jgi:hypothetical protein
MMGKIYSMAQHTIFHLGSLNSTIEDKIESSNERDRREAAYALSNAPWFSRIWVLQELILSKDPWVQSGKSRWRWDHICEFLKNNLSAEEGLDFVDKQDNVNDLIAKMNLTPSSHAMHMNRVRQRYVEGRKPTLSEILVDRRGLGVEDPRDIIWAHLSFVGAGQKKSIPPDYKNATLVDLFNGVSSHHLGVLRRVHHLTHVSTGMSSKLRPKGFASWAPDWRKPWYDPMIGLLKITGRIDTISITPGVAVKINDLQMMCFLERKTRPLRCSTLLSFPESNRLTYQLRFKNLVEASQKQNASQKPKFRYLYRDSRDLYVSIHRSWQHLVNDKDILPNLPSFFGSSKPSKALFNHLVNSVKYTYTGLVMKGSSQLSNFLSTFNDHSYEDYLKHWLIFAFLPGFDGTVFNNLRLACFWNRLALVSSDVNTGDFMCVGNLQSQTINGGL